MKDYDDDLSMFEDDERKDDNFDEHESYEDFNERGGRSFNYDDDDYSFEDESDEESYE